METFTLIIQRVTRVGTILAGIFLIGAMLLVVASVISRFFNVAITGSIELMQLMISVTIAFALAYTALRKGHVVVNILISRFPVMSGAIIGVVISFISLAIWILMSYAGAQFIFEKGMTELSETLRIPYAPFRSIFTLGLLLLSLSFVSDIFENLKKVVCK